MRVVVRRQYGRRVKQESIGGLDMFSILSRMMWSIVEVCRKVRKEEGDEGRKGSRWH